MMASEKNARLHQLDAIASDLARLRRLVETNDDRLAVVRRTRAV
jgi:hypothetical protein